MGLTNGVLTAPFTKIAANGNGDLQRALESSSLSHTYLLTVPVPNKWAKYQGFVSGRIYTDRYTDTGSQRLAGLKAANWGWGTNGIPSDPNWSVLRSRLGSVTPGAVWTRERPTANDILRAMDYDGYQMDAWGKLGVYAKVNLVFPFNGLLTIPDTLVGPYDVIKYANCDPTRADGDSDRLLYLDDFASMTDYSAGYYNYTDWYFGLLLVKQGSNPTAAYLVNTLETIKHYADNYDYPELGGIPFQYGGGGIPIPSGDYYLYPVINSRRVSTLRNFAQIQVGWGDESQGPGRLVLLDGWRLPVSVDANKVGLAFNYTINVSGGKTTIAMTVKNNSGLAASIGINQMFIYVTSDGVQNGEYEDYEAVMDALQAWKDDGTRYTSGITRNSRTVSVYEDVYSAFYTANGNSREIAAGGSVSFSVTLNSDTDPLDYPYDQYTEVDLCFGVNMNGVFERRTL